MGLFGTLLDMVGLGFLGDAADSVSSSAANALKDKAIDMGKEKASEFTTEKAKSYVKDKAVDYAKDKAAGYVKDKAKDKAKRVAKKMVCSNDYSPKIECLTIQYDVLYKTTLHENNHEQVV